MSGSQQHPYHLVEPSPWPAVGSAAAFITAIGGVMFMHERAYARPEKSESFNPAEAAK